MLQCPGDARIDLQINNISHKEEDTVYGASQDAKVDP